jgi:Tol biopolymer transport system component
LTARRIDGVFGIDGVFAYTDGQRTLSFNSSTNELISTDLATKKTRVIYKHKPGAILGNVDATRLPASGLAELPQRLSFAPSRDLSMILLFEKTAYINSLPAVAVIGSDGTGLRRIGRLPSAGALAAPSTWSWDNRYVLFAEPQPDGSSRLARLTIADGHIQEILRRESAVISAANFSPDGRFIAFAEGVANTSKVFILPAQGGEARMVSNDSTLLDWTRDGRYLAINSGPQGSRALYLLPVNDGQPTGNAVFVRNGSIEFGMTTASGALFYVARSPSATMYLGKLDGNSHIESWKPLLTGFIELPTWSPDDNQIAYNSYAIEGDHRTAVVHVRDLATGTDRDLYRNSDTRNLVCQWAAKHFRLSCTANTGAVTDVLSVAADTGKVERLDSLPGTWIMWWPTPDDSGFYLVDVGKSGTPVRWDIATHEMTPMGPGANISPDGRFLWAGGKPKEPQSDPALRMTLQIRPSSSPEWKLVGFFRMEPWTAPGPIHVVFSYDGNWLYFHSRDEAGKDSLYRFSTSGGTQAERLGDFPSHVIQGTLAISRDGGKFIAVAYDANVNQTEAWLLENFIPKPAPTR